MPEATFTVVTPCKNSGRLLRATIESVLRQTAIVSGRARLEYTVVDGASLDDTVSVARATGDIRVISEPDRGMYDALAKGLQAGSGDVYCYLNAGDLFAATAFDVVLDVLADTRIQWLTGMNVNYNEKGQVTYARLPFRYRRSSIQNGLHGGRLPAVQQESTFWTASLQKAVDLEALRGYRLAGDHYLWSTFARTADLYIVSSHLGGFCHHGEHLSVDYDRYLDEMTWHTRRPSPRERLVGEYDRLMWRAPDRLKKMANPDTLLRYDLAARAWR